MARRHAAALALVLAGAGLAACGDDEPLSSEVEPTVTEADPGSTTTAAAATANEQIAGVMADPGLAAEVLERDPPDPARPDADLAADALEVTTLIEGDDAAQPVADGDVVAVHYVGALADGTVFDESWSVGQPFVTPVPGQVIEGWNRGLRGVRPGQRIRLDIGSDLAYGDTGSGSIPPSAPLSFVIDIVGVLAG